MVPRDCFVVDVVEFVDEVAVQNLGELSIDIGKPFQSVEDKTVKVRLVSEIKITIGNKYLRIKF